MYLEVSHNHTVGQDRSEVVVPAQREPFEVRELEAGGLSLVLVGFGIDPCYLCLLFPFFFGSFSELLSFDSERSSSTRLSPDLLSDVIFRICRSTCLFVVLFR